MFAVCKGKRAKRRIPFRHYTPEVSTKTTIINFAVKQQGLESQLLGIVVVVCVVVVVPKIDGGSQLCHDECMHACLRAPICCNDHTDDF